MLSCKKVERFNVLIPSRTRLVGRRRPNSRMYSLQRQVPIWQIRKTTPARAGTEFRTPDQPFMDCHLLLTCGPGLGPDSYGAMRLLVWHADRMVPVFGVTICIYSMCGERTPTEYVGQMHHKHRLLAEDMARVNMYSCEHLRSPGSMVIALIHLSNRSP